MKISAAILAVVVLGVMAAVHLKWKTSLTSLFPEDIEAVRDLKRMSGGGDDDVFQVVEWNPTGVDSMPELVATLQKHGFKLAPQEPSFAPLAYSLRLATLPPEYFQRMQAEISKDRLASRLQATRVDLAGFVNPASMALIRFDPLRLYEFFPDGEMGVNRGYHPVATARIAYKDRPEVSYDRLRQELEAWKLKTGHSFGLTGAPAFAVEISREMNRDMQRLLPMLLGLILLVFLAVYQRVRPLLLLGLVQIISVSASLIVAWVFFGGLNAIGLGFASILLGIGVDYAILMIHPGGDQGKLVRGVILSAATTAVAFVWLALSDFPGIRQVGCLVAVGIPSAAIAAVVLAPAFRKQSASKLDAGRGAVPLTEGKQELINGKAKKQGWLAVAGFSGVLTAALVALFVHGLPLDLSAEKLIPRQTPAWKTQAVLLSPEVEKGMRDMANDFTHLMAAMEVNRNGASPYGWPGEDLWKTSLHHTGFGLSWGAQMPEVFGYLRDFQAGDETLIETLRQWTAWPRLGKEARMRAWNELPVIFTACLLSILILLRLGLGRWRWSLICIGMALAALILLGGVLSLLGIELTLISVLCLPIIPGLAVDYAIHIHLAATNEPTLRSIWKNVGTPILVAALTSACGFFILAFSSQPVLSNLGLTLGWGIVCALLVNFLGIPLLICGATPSRGINPQPVHSETLYRNAVFDRLVAICGLLPRKLLNRVAYMCGYLYGCTHPKRSRIVSDNLALIAPELKNMKYACRTYGNFATTLSDYFYINSLSDDEVSGWISDRIGKEHLLEVYRRGRGGIILSMHHGFFEFGGWMMRELGIPFSVVTNPEPSEALTRWRSDYRRRWDAETIVLGHDGFSNLQLADPIRQGRLVALLFDRPHPIHSIPVKLPQGTAYFSGNFLHVARSLECPVLPAPVLRNPNGTYRFEVLPPIYIKSQGSREETVNHYIQKITDAFLPYLCQYPESWYQFVPLTEKGQQPEGFSSHTASASS